MTRIRWNVVAAVYRAEILSVLRDRWTVVISVLVPVLLYPTAGIVLSTVVVKSVGTLRSEKSAVCLLGSQEDAAGLAPAFGRETPPVTEVVPCDGRQEPGKGAAIVRIPEGTTAKLAAGETVDLEVLYNSNDVRGAMAKERAERALDRFRQAEILRRVDEAKLPKGFAQPLRVKSKDVAPPQQADLYTWAPAVVMLVILFSALGVFLPSIDLTAGDRERNTLETLMTAPVATTELIAGKFGVVFTIGIVSTLLNVASLYGTAQVTLASAATQTQFSIGPGVAAAILFATLPAVALSSAVCMAVGCLARSFRDAQNYLTPIYLALVMPAYVAALPTLKLTSFTAAIPLVNLPLILKDILAGDVDGRLVLLASVIDVLFCGAALMAAARLYGHEGIAFADAEPLDLLKRPSSATLRFTTGEALALCGVCAALFFYVGTPITVRFGRVGVLLTLLLAFLAPPIAWATWRRLDWRVAFAFRAPGWRAAGAALLLGASLWVPVTLYMQFVQQPLFPMPPEMVKAMRDLLNAGGAAWPAMIVIGAVTPALAEEVLFRGAVMQSLRPGLGRGAVVVSALLFALMHLSPWRLVPTFLVGLVIGAIVLRTGSIWTGILLHFAHNAALITIDTFVVPHGPDGAETSMPFWLWIVPAITFPVGLWLLRKPPLHRRAFP